MAGYSSSLSIRTLPFQSLSFEIASPVIEHIHLDVQNGKITFGKLSAKASAPEISDYMNAFYTQFEHLWTCRKIAGKSQVSVYLFRNAHIFCVEDGNSNVPQNALARHGHVFIKTATPDNAAYDDWKESNQINLHGFARYREFLHGIKNGRIAVVA